MAYPSDFILLIGLLIKEEIAYSPFSHRSFDESVSMQIYGCFVVYRGKDFL